MLKLVGVNKSYKMGETTVYALSGINLTIENGDYVAVMGPSGSGKSTLMNILGLLDTPSAGEYQISGKNISHFTEDQLAILRRETIGFIFQQFNLLPRMSAFSNICLPLLYSRLKDGRAYGQALLKRIGMEDRSGHNPNELSGGQQQRIAVARSLINRPKIIFADEPTGNLDSSSEAEILTLLKELNDEGITVVIVTHEEEIGQRAKRLIRMRDGKIQSDTRLTPLVPVQHLSEKNKENKKRNFVVEFFDYIKLGIKTLNANKIRTGLSVLGILIGVAAVIAILAIGSGAQKAIETQLASLGSNLLILRPGALRVGGVTQEVGSSTRLSMEDAAYLKNQLDYVKQVSANVNSRGQLIFQNKNWNTQITGGSESYAAIHSALPPIGRFYTEADNLKRSRVAVIGMTVVRELFGTRNPIGEMIKINKINFQVIGILPEKGANGYRDQDDAVLIPVLTAMHRLMGKDYVDSIELEITDPLKMEEAEQRILELMNGRHKVLPNQKESAFEIRNMADIQAAVQESTKTISLLLSSVAAISLLVGGIGIMNIMLVSVTERTKEIGLRKAVGARRWDILAQFLAESMAVSSIGGVAGIAVGCGIAFGINYFSGWNTSISFFSVIVSFLFSASIGIIFGIYPARKASLLNPISALRHE